MKQGILTVLLIAVVVLSGCAKPEDVQMVQAHMNAEVDIANAKSKAIEAQAHAISVTIGNDSTDLERYLAREQIAGLQMTESGLKAITTGNDVLITVAKDGKTMVRDIVTGTVLYRGVVGLTDAFKNAGDTTITASEGSNVEYSKTESKQIVAGKNNTAHMEPAAEAVSEGECEQEGWVMRDNGVCISPESAAERAEEEAAEVEEVE